MRQLASSVHASLCEYPQTLYSTSIQLRRKTSEAQECKLNIAWHASIVFAVVGSTVFSLTAAGRSLNAVLQQAEGGQGHVHSSAGGVHSPHISALFTALIYSDTPTLSSAMQVLLPFRFFFKTAHFVAMLTIIFSLNTVVDNMTGIDGSTASGSDLSTWDSTQKT